MMRILPRCRALFACLLVTTMSITVARGCSVVNSYHVEEVSYENEAAGITLSGTLTVPEGDGEFPVVILITGYGPQDRDATSMGHKRFLVLADYLTQQGIVVLRFDKRGVGKSTGNYTLATSKELADDVVAGIEFLKERREINHHQIGLVGLSEGGLIAAMVAEQSKDVAFAVLMAPAVAMSIDDIAYHTELQLRADGASQEFIDRDKKARKAVYAVVKEEQDQEVATQRLQKIIADYLLSLPESQKIESAKLPFAFTQANADSYIKTLTSPGYRFFLTYDPSPMLKGIQVPVLVIAGDRDWIVTPKRIFPIIERAFTAAEKSNYAMVELKNLNHAFQTCQTGALAEYATIGETMSPVAMKTISEWILLEAAKIT